MYYLYVRLSWMVAVTHWFIKIYVCDSCDKSEKRNKNQTIKREKKNVDKISDRRLNSL